MKKYLAFTILLMSANAGYAASLSGSGANPAIPSPLPVSGPIQAIPQSGALTNCQGGTGSIVATVGTQATLVCAAGTTRLYWRIANMNASGAPYVYCTDDGSTPTLNHWTFIAYPQGYQDSLGMPIVSPAVISCIASSSTGITALAVQTGAAP